MRKGLLTIAVLIFALGLAALASGLVDSSIVFILWAAVFAAALIFERFRYKRLIHDAPGPGWQRTAERFVDDETGKVVTVYLKPETGERVYVADEHQASP